MNSTALAALVEAHDQPPADLTELQRALWLAKANRWEEAHELSQELPAPGGAWIHAWLHRQEGDYQNACYWYQTAGKPAPPEGSDLLAEWAAIADELDN